jgi:hypothetical protein
VLARGSLDLGWRSYGCAPRTARVICCSAETRVQSLAGGREYHRRQAFDVDQSCKTSSGDETNEREMGSILKMDLDVRSMYTLTR